MMVTVTMFPVLICLLGVSKNVGILIYAIIVSTISYVKRAELIIMCLEAGSEPRRFGVFCYLSDCVLGRGSFNDKDFKFLKCVKRL